MKTIGVWVAYFALKLCLYVRGSIDLDVVANLVFLALVGLLLVLVIWL